MMMFRNSVEPVEPQFILAKYESLPRYLDVMVRDANWMELEYHLVSQKKSGSSNPVGFSIKNQSISKTICKFLHFWDISNCYPTWFCWKNPSPWGAFPLWDLYMNFEAAANRWFGGLDGNLHLTMPRSLGMYIEFVCVSGWWNQFFLFSPLFGEDSHFD